MGCHGEEPSVNPDADSSCAACQAPKPYADHGTKECVSECPEGTSPNGVNACACPAGAAPTSDNDCQACEGEKPFADHSTHQCVDQCPSGHAPNAAKDCHDCSKIAETVAAASSGNSTASNGTSYSNTELLRSVQLLLDLDTQLQQSSKLTGSEKPYADHVLNQCVATCSSGHA